MKKRTRTPAAAMKLTWSTHESLSLNSERIEEFLSQRVLSHEPDFARAMDFFKKIRVMMDDSNWILTTQRAEFRALNRTGGTIRSVQATVDFFADDSLFHVADMKRTFIEPDQPFEFAEDILHRVYEVAGVIRDEYGEPLGLKSSPELSCRFREYTVEISDKHRMFDNEYVRGVAGIIPMKKNSSDFDRFVESAEGLTGDLREKADRIMDNISRLTEISLGSAEKTVRVDGFISRYFPTLAKAVKSYCDRPDQSKADELSHTLEVMSISTDNLCKSISGNEDDLSSIEQKILKQQLIREGLYSPFEDHAPSSDKI